MTAARRTDTAHLHVVRDDETQAIPAPWLLPPVTTRDQRPTMAARWSRIRRSPFARDVKRGLDDGLWLLGLIALMFALLVVTVHNLGVLP